MGGMVAYAEGALDHGRHPTSGPDVADEAMGLGSLRQERRELAALLDRQPRLLAWARPCSQRLPAASLAPAA